jgi:hypothetical protein
MKFKVGDKVRINWNLGIYYKVCMQDGYSWTV